MAKFCTNCGHSNKDSNLVCVECGTPIVQQEKKTENRSQVSASASHVKPSSPKTPLPFKYKIISLIAFILIAGMAGAYTWGTKTVSAEAVVSNFFDALRENDAEALSQQVILSDGQKVTEKEAAAFIKLYAEITHEELNEMAKVEKNGKLIGIIDKHKIVLTPQQVSYRFPYEGLTLKLNGKAVERTQNDADEYVFSGIVPGLHDAEFVYNGEFTEFGHPFELAVTYQYDEESILPIEEELPVSSVVFELDTFDGQVETGNVIKIGDKEIPVDAHGKTEKIGPLLLDGSIEATAEIVFPWGTQTSDPVPVTDIHQQIDIKNLPEKHTADLKKQLTKFAEEYVQAYGTRDSSVFTTVTDEHLEEYEESIERMKDDDSFFKGALTKINLFEGSFTISPDGQSVIAAAEIWIDSGSYYRGEKPVLESVNNQSDIVFQYNSEQKKWLVNQFIPYDWSENLIPSETIEGSQKFYEVAGASDTPKADKVIIKDVEGVTKEASLEKRVQNFLNQYTAAMEKGDYGKMYDMWENSIYDTTIEDYNNNKAEYINEIEIENEEGAKVEASMKLVKIIDESASRHGDTYIKSLVEINWKLTKNGEILEGYQGLAHVYTIDLAHVSTKGFNSEYGFLIDDDVDYLDE